MEARRRRTATLCKSRFVASSHVEVWILMSECSAHRGHGMAWRVKGRMPRKGSEQFLRLHCLVMLCEQVKSLLMWFSYQGFEAGSLR